MEEVLKYLFLQFLNKTNCMKMKIFQTIRRLIIGLILIGIGTNSARSQTRINIPKDIKVDTLSLEVHYPYDFVFAKQARYDQILEQVIQKANSKFSFHTELGDPNSKYSIVLEMGPIIYSTKKDDLHSTIYNLLFIGGHVVMLGSFGWSPPVLIISVPQTTSDVTIFTNDNLRTNSKAIESQFQTSGYFASQSRQDRRFERGFEKSMYRMVKYINKQNVRNNK